MIYSERGVGGERECRKGRGDVRGREADGELEDSFVASLFVLFFRFINVQGKIPDLHLLDCHQLLGCRH